MGWRFRRTIKILPGVHLNVSRSGISTSFGPRGVHVTIGPRGIRRTVGIPGTGVSYTENEPLHHEAGQPAANAGGVGIVAVIVLLVLIGILVRLFR